MKFPTVSRLLACASVFLFAILLTAAAASARKPPKPGGGGGAGGFSTTSTYVKNYANVLNGVRYDLTPRDVLATPDGGSISLATTPSATNGVGVAWLLKTSAVGAPQWSEEVGCLGTPPGDYSDAVARPRAHRRRQPSSPPPRRAALNRAGRSWWR